MKGLNDIPGRLLVIGIGNSGRGDDGLGWRFVEMISDGHYPLLDCEFRYQLQIEDASLVANYDLIIFVDASQEELKEGYRIDLCLPASYYAYSSHAQEPGAILYLTNNLYNKFPKAYLLAIAGEEWELKTELSEHAEKNLQAAFSFLSESFLPAIQPDMVNRLIPLEAEDIY